MTIKFTHSGSGPLANFVSFSDVRAAGGLYKDNKLQREMSSSLNMLARHMIGQQQEELINTEDLSNGNLYGFVLPRNLEKTLPKIPKDAAGSLLSNQRM